MSYRVRVKICGVTRPADLADACAAGADAIGLNFAPPSPRAIDLAVARELLAAVPCFVTPVAVFARQRFAEVRATLAQLGRISAFQVHGSEPEVIDASPWHYVPAFQVRSRADLDGIESYLARCRAAGRLPSALLVDGYAPGLVGGTGVAAPWALLADFRPGVPLILAGGLTPDNVAEAVRTVRPWAVDVASGVETSPGVKGRDKVRRFLDEALRGAAEVTAGPDSPCYREEDV